MIRLKKLVFLWIAVLVIQAKCADKYTDENRPYEFGFSIDGEQHRHEKKDKNGIIMGEFGFITADGVYHVTVYATDENGGFKILSMKNIRVKPYPTAKSGPEKGRSLEIPSAPQASQKLSTQAQKSPSPQEPQKPGPASPAKSCSHCSLPTTTTTTTTSKPPPVSAISREPEVPPKYDQSNQYYPSGNANTQVNPSQQQQSYGNQQSFPQQNAYSQSSPQQQQRVENPQNAGLTQNNPQLNQNIENYPQNPSQGGLANSPNQGIGNYPQQSSSVGGLDNMPNQNIGNYPQQNPSQGGLANSPNQNIGNNPQQSFLQGGLNNSPYSQSYSQNGAQPNQQPSGPAGAYPQSETSSQRQDQSLQYGANRNPKSYGDQSHQQQTPQDAAFNPSGSPQIGQKPQLISAQMQIVDKNTDIHHKRPGEEEGLPKGLNKDDMTNLLYTFNYTVGFHGHFEEGYTNGAKQGYYFVTGRNGVRTRIDYVADEHGFRPKITQEVLDLLSDDVPKPETEKDPKYGLKGYEFKWLYFPVGSNRR